MILSALRRHPFLLILVVGPVSLALAGCGRPVKQEKPRAKAAGKAAPAIPAPSTRETAPASETTEQAAPERAVIEMDKGRIVIELFPDVAPKTVANFKSLIQKGFYNNLTFHRVEPGFVVQGGDPLGNGSGGPGYTIEAEFNSKPHVKGTVAMARAADPDSAGSQFYIALDRLPTLDRNYTVFGQVVEGMDVVDKIAVGDVMKRVYLEPVKPE